MKLRSLGLKRPARAKTNSVKTTFMDLLQEIGKLTNDDALAVAVLKNILECCKVRSARTLAPVRLAVPHQSHGQISKRIRTTGSSWV